MGPNIYRCSESLHVVSYCTEIQCKKSFHFVSNHIRNRYNLLSDRSIRGSETLLLIFEVPPKHTYYPGFINDRTETIRWHSLGQDHRKAFNQALIMLGCGFFFFFFNLGFPEDLVLRMKNSRMTGSDITCQSAYL